MYLLARTNENEAGIFTFFPNEEMKKYKKEFFR